MEGREDLIYFIENNERKSDLSDEEAYEEMRKRLESIFNCRVIVRHYSRCSIDEVERLKPLAIVLGGSGTPWEKFITRNWSREFEIIKKAEVPILGICGSHQIIGMAYHEPNRKLGCSPIRRLREDEEDRNRGTHMEGYFVEKGYLPVKILKRDDPLFEGLNETIIVDEGHYCEIKRLPAEFELLASTDECRIQAMRHKSRPLYGVQFHPQIFDDEHPDGRRIIENFLKIARRWRESRSTE